MKARRALRKPSLSVRYQGWLIENWYPRLFRFSAWYGFGRPGFNGGIMTGLIIAVIIQVLILLTMWWLHV